MSVYRYGWVVHEPIARQLIDIHNNVLYGRPLIDFLIQISSIDSSVSSRGKPYLS